MATVIKIIEDFLSQNKDFLVEFRGGDEKRHRLYRIIISRELTKINEKFEVYGGKNEDFITKFEVNQQYDYSIIRLRK